MSTPIFIRTRPNRAGCTRVPAASIDKFDSDFFGISPREARRIDPQQRIVLELTWDALESAGMLPGRLGGSQTGVFVGISFSDYAALQREFPDEVDACVMSGSAISNAANRISYIFDLHGPSFAVDTAWSSSLVAVHEACVGLWRGESSLAIAAGVNALLSPSGAVGFSKAHMLSPTGRCHPFDTAGNGYIRSEGGAVIVSQPLAQAIAERNPVFAVIVGSGVNSDGRTTGLAMPNPVAIPTLELMISRRWRSSVAGLSRRLGSVRPRSVLRPRRTPIPLPTTNQKHWLSQRRSCRSGGSSNREFDRVNEPPI